MHGGEKECMRTEHTRDNPRVELGVSGAVLELASYDGGFAGLLLVGATDYSNATHSAKTTSNYEK